MTYNQNDAKTLLHNKFVVVIGDSIQRSVYKDLVTLLNANRLTKESELRKKGEPSHCFDEVFEQSELTNAKHYREVRQYQTDTHLVRYYFVTRVYSDYVETVLLDLSKEPNPDVVLINSCLWDMSRYGPDGDESYKENLQMFFTRAEQMLPKETLVIWLSGMPVSNEPKAGVLPRSLKFLGGCYPSMVRVANFFAAQVARVYERNYLDAHFHFVNRKHLRNEDGVHWNTIAHRFLTNMILKHIARAWDVEEPRRSLLGDDMDVIESQFKEQINVVADRNGVSVRNGHQRSISMPTPLNAIDWSRQMPLVELPPFMNGANTTAAIRMRDLAERRGAFQPYPMHQRNGALSQHGGIYSQANGLSRDSPVFTADIRGSPLLGMQDARGSPLLGMQDARGSPLLGMGEARGSPLLGMPDARFSPDLGTDDTYDPYGSDFAPIDRPNVPSSFYTTGLTQHDLHGKMKRSDVFIR